MLIYHVPADTKIIAGDLLTGEMVNGTRLTYDNNFNRNEMINRVDEIDSFIFLSSETEYLIVKADDVRIIADGEDAA